MDKNMVNIDELVRQRLSGGEEQARPDAWLQMRELLDENEKRRMVGGYNWRRMLTAATGLVLLASLTVGGYKMYTGYRADSDVVASTGSNSSANGTPNFRSGSSNDNHNENNIPAATGTDIASSNDNQTSKSTSVNSNKTIALNSSVEKIDKANNTKEVESGIAKNDIPQSKTARTNNSTTNNNNSNPNTANSSVTNHNSFASKTNRTTNTTTANNSNNNSTSNTTATTGSRSAMKTSNATESAPVQPTSPQQLVSDETSTNASVSEKAVARDNTKKKEPVLQKDSIQKVAINQKLKVDPIRGVVEAIYDTTSITKIGVDKALALNATENNSKEVNSNNVASTNPNSTTNTTASNSSKSENTTKRSADRSREEGKFKQMLENAKGKIGQIKFYPGMTFGGNSYLYGPNSLWGFQIGARGVIKVDEKWSMLTELKYMQRFNQNYNVKDHYWNVISISGNKYVANEIEHFFKFSALHTFEMPIAVRYALFKNIHIFAGPNLVYNWKVNAEEVTRTAEAKIYTGNSFLLNSKPSIGLDDFGSRFSAGYLFGVSVEASPVFDIDLRMTKNFWDNAAGTGRRKVSDQLLYMPSLQISVGYRFNQRNPVPPAK